MRLISHLIILLVALVVFSTQVCRAESSQLIFTNKLGMEFVLIKPGTFIMGTQDTFGNIDKGVLLSHLVSITKPFYMGRYEVTQGQWEVIMDTNPSEYKDAKRPVTGVSWEQACIFIKKLNALADSPYTYALPTEAEWEYAAKAGSKVGTYSDPSSFRSFEWYGNNSGNMPQQVGRKHPNAFGVYDMLGNVSEWVRDWYAMDTYVPTGRTDPSGPDQGAQRVRRGGNYRNAYTFCHPAYRTSMDPYSTQVNTGFRVACYFRDDSGSVSVRETISTANKPEEKAKGGFAGERFSTQNERRLISGKALVTIVLVKNVLWDVSVIQVKEQVAPGGKPLLPDGEGTIFSVSETHEDMLKMLEKARKTERLVLIDVREKNNDLGLDALGYRSGTVFLLETATTDFNSLP